MTVDDLISEIESYSYTPRPARAGLDIESIPLDDAPTWDLISSGNTKGVFQFESRLGQTWCEKIKPRSIEELSDITSAIRPGCLQARNNAGESMTKVYADTKHGIKSLVSLHTSIDDITNKTYGVILFQEQAMQIAATMAGFDGYGTNKLRKGIGKKDAKLILAIREEFINGCLKQGHNQEDAEKVFDVIQKSATSSYNLSHSIEYSINSYRAAYLKANYPLAFHLMWLRHARSKPDTKLEMRELIMSARGMGIEVRVPQWSRLSAEFEIIDGSIYFGVSNVKNCGIRDFTKLTDLKTRLPVSPTYCTMLFLVFIACNKRAIENLITVGVFDEFKQTRTQMLHDLRCVSELTDKELEFAKEYISHNPDASLGDVLLACIPTRKTGGAAHTESRSIKLYDLYIKWSTPGKSLIDVPAVYTGKEEELLGVAISYSRVEATGHTDLANTTCLEFRKGMHRPTIIIACEILTVREHKCKNDAIMAFLTVEDETSELDNILVFGDIYEEYGSNIYEGAIALLFGERSKDSLIIKKVELI